MLRVTNARTGRPVEIAPARRGLLLMSVHLPCSDLAVGVTELRALLAADVVVRLLEADGLQVHDVLAVRELSAEQAKAVEHAGAALAVHPPAAGSSVPDGAEATLGGPADVQVCGDGCGDVHGGTILKVGPGSQEPAVVRLWMGEGGAEDAAADADPLAVRLALLERHYAEQVFLTHRQCAAAVRQLRGWRRRVAGWARSPSRPIPDEIRHQVRAALADDLDLPGVLEVLGAVEVASSVPDGAKFETFAWADTILGLELVRDVGRA